MACHVGTSPADTGVAQPETAARTTMVAAQERTRRNWEEKWGIPPIYPALDSGMDRPVYEAGAGADSRLSDSAWQMS